MRDAAGDGALVSSEAELLAAGLCVLRFAVPARPARDEFVREFELCVEEVCRGEWVLDEPDHLHADCEDELPCAEAAAVLGTCLKRLGPDFSAVANERRMKSALRCPVVV